MAAIVTAVTATIVTVTIVSTLAWHQLETSGLTMGAALLVWSASLAAAFFAAYILLEHATTRTPTEKQPDLTAIRDRLLRNISHELRTPLSSIVGYSELILESNDSLDQGVTDDLKKIHRAGIDLLELVDTVLDFSASSPAPLVLESLDLEKFVGDLLFVAETMASATNNRFEATNEAGPLVLETEQRRLEKILLALLSNAFKFTEHGEVKLVISLLKDQVRFDVVDRGCGISAQDLEVIFDPMIQIDVESDCIPGLGMGLAVAQKLAGELGGSLTARSEPGHGSTFTLLIPKLEPNIVVTEPQRFTASHCRALLIDEHDEAAELFERALHEVCAVTHINSVREGVSGVKRHHPDIVFLDPESGSFNGWAILQHLKFDPETRHIPVVVFSAEQNYPLAERYAADAYLIKPASMEQLRQTLKKNLPESTEDNVCGERHAGEILELRESGNHA